jgi:hypothetical protein
LKKKIDLGVREGETTLIGVYAKGWNFDFGVKKVTKG